MDHFGYRSASLKGIFLEGCPLSWKEGKISQSNMLMCMCFTLNIFQFIKNLFEIVNYIRLNRMFCMKSWENFMANVFFLK